MRIQRIASDLPKGSIWNLLLIPYLPFYPSDSPCNPLNNCTLRGRSRRRIRRRWLCSSCFAVPELCVECWLPLEADRCGGCGGLGPFRGEPGGSVSVMDIRLAMGLTTGGVVGLAPPAPTASCTWAATAALNWGPIAVAYTKSGVEQKKKKRKLNEHEFQREDTHAGRLRLCIAVSVSYQ